MSRHFHAHLPHPRTGGERPSQAAAWGLILLLAILAAVWMNIPQVVSLLPIHPPG